MNIQTASDNKIYQKIEEYIDNALQSWNVPGGAVAIVNAGEVTSCKGYGVTEIGKDQKVTAQTLFPIGSCTKAFTAAALGILVDEGKIKWDDKIIRYLPDFQLSDPWVTNEITIRDILSHRSGLGRAIRLMNRQSKFDSQDFIRRIRYLPFTAGFREKFGYNNPHFIIAGQIVEVISGQTWGNFIEKRIFEPLGMTSSFTSYQKMLAAQPDSIAQPHAAKCDLFIPSELCALDPVQRIPWTDYGENAAGSIISSLDDLTIWLQFLMNQGVFNQRQIIQPETISEMTKSQMLINSGDSEMDMLLALGLPINIMTYGLGWYVSDYRGERFVFHPGQVNGSVAAIAYLPARKLGGIIVLNTYQTMLHPMVGFYLIDTLLGFERDYAQEMLDNVQQWKKEAGFGAQQMSIAHPPAPEVSYNHDAFCGEYVNDLFGEILIFSQDGKLEFQYGETQIYRAELEYWQEKTFLIRYQQPFLCPEFLTFKIKEDGKVDAIEIDRVGLFHRIKSS